MSNSRKIKRSVKRNVSAVSMAALGTVTVGGVLMTTAGTAFAAAPAAGTATENLAPGSTATTVYPGLTNQPAASLLLTVPNTFAAGDSISLPIEPGGAAQTDPTTAVNYSAAPTVAAAMATGASTSDTVPTFTATLTTNPADANAVKNAGVKDDLVLTFTNSFTGTATDNYTLTVSGIKYDVAAAAGSAAGPVPVQVPAQYTPAGATTPTAGVFTYTDDTNAFIQNFQITETPNGVATGTTGFALSPFKIAETVPTVLPGGVYTLAPAAGTAAPGVFSGTATVTAVGFTIAPVSSTGTCPAPGAAGVGSTATVTANAAGQYQFCVVTQTNATTKAGSITVSGMTYNASAAAGSVNVTLTPATPAAPPNPASYTSVQPAITQVVQSRIAGVSADDTAAKAALATVPHYGGGGPVILASDAEYQDALSASFLGYAPLQFQTFGGTFPTYNGPTPVLLNPYDAPNGTEAQTAAVNAIRQMGATTVYIVGGTAAISQDVQTQLSQIQVGSTITGAPVNLQVIRIAGQTAEQTAAMVAQYPGSSNNIGFPATPGAYGMYNSGASESASSPFTTGTNVPTAVLADADEFQDALAASGLAYHYNLPVLLNAGGQGLDSSAAASLSNMGIKQVIVVGGSAAVSDAAVAGLQAIGISVLRIAGTTFDATAQNLAAFETNYYTAPPVAPATTPQVQDGLGSTANYGGTSLTVGTSRGDAYQDALSSAQVLGNRIHTVVPLLLNTGVSSIATGTANFLSSNGTSPAGGLTVYNPNAVAPAPTTYTENVVGDLVFGGTLAQTPALVQTELNDIAAG